MSGKKKIPDVAYKEGKKVWLLLGTFFFYLEEFDLFFLKRFSLMWLHWEYSHWMKRGEKDLFI